MFLTTLCDAQETSVVKSTKAQVAVTHTERAQWLLDERDPQIDLFAIQTRTSTSSTHNELVPSQSWSVDYLCLMVLLFEIDAASSEAFVGLFSHQARLSRYPSSMETFVVSLLRAMVHS